MCVLICSVMSDSCNAMDCSLPGSSVRGIFQGRILEWVVISYIYIYLTHIYIYIYLTYIYNIYHIYISHLNIYISQLKTSLCSRN